MASIASAISLCMVRTRARGNRSRKRSVHSACGIATFPASIRTRCASDAGRSASASWLKLSRVTRLSATSVVAPPSSAVKTSTRWVSSGRASNVPLIRCASRGRSGASGAGPSPRRAGQGASPPIRRSRPPRCPRPPRSAGAGNGPARRGRGGSPGSPGPLRTRPPRGSPRGPSGRPGTPSGAVASTPPGPWRARRGSGQRRGPRGSSPADARLRAVGSCAPPRRPARPGPRSGRRRPGPGPPRAGKPSLPEEAGRGPRWRPPDRGSSLGDRSPGPRRASTGPAGDRGARSFPSRPDRRSSGDVRPGRRALRGPGGQGSGTPAPGPWTGKHGSLFTILVMVSRPPPGPVPSAAGGVPKRTTYQGRLRGPAVSQRTSAARRSLLKKSVTPVDVTRVHGLGDLLEAFQGTSIQARNLGKCLEVWENALTDRRRPTILVGLAGPLIAAGLRKVLRDMIDWGLVDVVVSTGAVLYQDIYQTIGGRHWVGTPTADDVRLRELYLDRIYDTYVDELKFEETDRAVGKITEQFDRRPASSREFLGFLGSRFDDRESILATAV